MSDWQLRAAVPGDEPFLEEMLRLAMGWRDGTRAELSPGTEKYVRGYGRPGDHGVVAVRDGEPIGATWCRLFAEADRSYGYVAGDVPELTLAVSPSARRAGVARGLLERLIADAAARGLGGLSLSVEPDNPARRLYEALGFTDVGGVGGSRTLLRRLRCAP